MIEEGEVKAIIDGDYKKLVKSAEVIGEYLKEQKLSPSQIRNIYTEVKELEMKSFEEKEVERRLLLLKPKLAYTAARPGAGRGVKELKKVVNKAIDAILIDGVTEEKFENFCKFFEAILAYHRAAGEKEKTISGE